MLFIQNISPLLIVSIPKFGTKDVGSLAKPKFKPAIWQDNAMANVQIVKEHCSMSTKLLSNI